MPLCSEKAMSSGGQDRKLESGFGSLPPKGSSAGDLVPNAVTCKRCDMTDMHVSLLGCIHGTWFMAQ